VERRRLRRRLSFFLFFLLKAAGWQAFFYLQNIFIMNYYIVKTEEDYEMKIMSVSVADEAAFLAEYAGKILGSGSTIQEALIGYGQRES